MSGPLSGVRIIEIEGIGPLPFAGMLLADMGAEILCVEPPRTRELRLGDDNPLMRGRARITLDLKDETDRERLLQLCETADVLIEGLRPGKMEALGLGPQECFARAPALVYGRMTGWGQDGPLAKLAGHDPTYVAYSGALAWLGRGGAPAMPPFSLVGDTAGGATYLVMGVLAALLSARTTGQGQVVDASIADGNLSLMSPLFGARRSGLANVPIWQAMMHGECPWTTIYETADGGHMVVCAMESAFYLELLERLGLDKEMLPNRNDAARWPELRQRFAETFASASRAEWERVFEGSDACAAPVLLLDEAEEHPVNTARGAFVDGLPQAAPRFSLTPSAHAPQGLSAEDVIAGWQSGSRR